MSRGGSSWKPLCSLPVPQQQLHLQHRQVVWIVSSVKHKQHQATGTKYKVRNLNHPTICTVILQNKFQMLTSCKMCKVWQDSCDLQKKLCSWGWFSLSPYTTCTPTVINLLLWVCKVIWRKWALNRYTSPFEYLGVLYYLNTTVQYQPPVGRSNVWFNWDF